MTKATRDRQRYIAAVIKPDTMALPGVAQAEARAVLQLEADKPLRGQALDMQFEGLFGEAHLQRELF